MSDGDPDGITAIFPHFFCSLCVAKRYSIYKITTIVDSLGNTNYSVAKISDGNGCISHKAAIAVEDVIIFTSDQGWHVLRNMNNIHGVETYFLSLQIQQNWVE